MTWLIPYLAALFAAGGLALGTDRLEHLAHEAFPVQGEIILVDGWPTHVLDRGEGPPVVLLHGIGGNTYVWQDSLLDEMNAMGLRVIAVDRPGHGHSARPDGMRGDPREQAAFLAATLDELGISEPVGLVGQSWGASVAAGFALLYPERVRAILFLAPYLAPGHKIFAPTYDLAKPRLVSDLVLETVAVPTSQLPRHLFAERMFHPDPVPDDWLDAPLLLSQTPQGIRTSAADMRAVGPALAEMSQRYGEISAPVTVVVGIDDQIVDPRDAMGFAVEHGWRLVPLPHTGHAVQYVETERLLEEMRHVFTVR